MARQKTGTVRAAGFRADDGTDPDQPVDYSASNPDQPVKFWLSFYGPAQYSPRAGSRTT